MDVYTKLTDLTSRYKGIVVALGMFDGVHIGHQSIIRRAVSLAREQGGTAMVFTFSNHPLAVLAPQALPPQIGNNLLRQTRLAELGVDVLMSIPFTRSFAGNSPEEFLQLLRQHMAPRCVVTGPNYTFGAKGKGNQRLLLREGASYGFATEICPAVLRDGRPVSSTRIRALLDQGNLGEANDFLGYAFTVMDRVIHGDQRGGHWASLRPILRSLMSGLCCLMVSMQHGSYIKANLTMDWQILVTIRRLPAATVVSK